MSQQPACQYPTDGTAVLERRAAGGLHWSAQICAAFASTLAAVGLLGWALGDWRRLAFGDQFVPMAPSTAWSILLLGCCVLAYSQWPSHRWSGHLTRFASISIAFMSLAVWAQWIGGFQLAVENWLTNSTDRVGSIPVGRMSPLTAATLGLIALAILLLPSSSGRGWLTHRAVSLLALVAFPISLIVILSYATGVPLLYDTHTIPMALLTALSLAILSSAILLLVGADVFRQAMVRDVNAQKQIEEALLASKRVAEAERTRYEQVVSMISDIIWRYEVDEQGRFVSSYISPVADRLLSFAAGFIGDSFQKFFSHVHPDDLPDVQKTLASALASPGRVETTEYRFLTPNGTTLWLQSRGSAYLQSDGHVVAYGSTSDITERKRVDEALRAALHGMERRHAETTVLLEAARTVLRNRDFESVAGQIFNLCKNHIGASAGYVALLNDDKQENSVVFLDVGGMPCSVDPSLPMPIRGLREIAYRTGKPAVENDFANSKWAQLMPPGHVPLVNAMFSPLTLEGRVVGVIGLANKSTPFTKEDAVIAGAFGDIAAIALLNSRNLESLIEAQANLEQYAAALELINSELEESKQAAESANRAKSEFLANMSHEIRTPMTAILGFTDVLLSNIDEPSSVEDLHTIKRNGEHLLAIINDILDVSKVEAGKLKLETVRWPVREIVEEVVSLLRVRADAKRLALTAEFIDPMPETIVTDPARLRQILVNLVGNAVKFTETGSVRIVTRFDETTGSHPKIRFDVIDTGVGISEDQIEACFRPFTQADGSSSRRFEGTGLGLTISRRLARMLGGNVTAKSTPGKGSTFTLLIDTEPPDGAAATEKQITCPATDAPTAEPLVPERNELKCRVLLAEDSADNQRLIAHILTEAGADVTVAHDGGEAVERALAGCPKRHGKPSAPTEPFDVIFMDIQMPVLDGYQATRRLRQQGYTGPIVALTAHAMEQDRRRCLDAGCDDYLAKPIDRAKLLAVAAAVLAGRQTAPPLPVDLKGKADTLAAPREEAFRVPNHETPEFQIIDQTDSSIGGEP